MACAMPWLTLAITGAGVPAAAVRPIHSVESNPGTPDASSVGRSGSSGEDFRPLTARALSWPVWSYSWAAPSPPSNGCMAMGRLRVHTHAGVHETDAVVFGIGLEPDTALARACGLEVDNGIVVDARGQTSDPAIYAVGDVANQPCAWLGAPPDTRLRLESWANAQNQGIAIGAALAGKAITQQDIPWFWSDQYDVNLQVLGMPSESGVHVLRGSAGDGKFCLFQLADGRLQAAVAVNMAKELKLAKRWLKQGRCPGAAELQDPAVRLDRL